MLKYADAQEKFVKAMDTLATDEGFRAFMKLRKQAGWGRFSFNNQINLLAQTYQRKQAPSDVLTATAWARDFGVKIRHDEYSKPLWVLKPVMVAKPDYDENGNRKPRDKQVLVGFSGLKQYAAWQVDGELPRHDDVIVSGDSHKHYEGILNRFAESRGYTVDTVEFNDTRRGDCNPETKQIRLSAKLEPNARVKTLVHELVHTYGFDYRKFERAECERIVETAAFLICSTIGLDVTEAAVDYVLSWADGDKAKALAVMQAADKAARAVEADIAKVTNAEGK